MTNEEAIARIKNHKIVHKMNEPRAIYISEALDMAIQALEQEPSRDMEEIVEVINCDADAETKCKMISNILIAKPHYFEEQEPAYCDRNICLRNEYNSIGCNECEVTKSQESNTVIGTGDGAYYRIKALQSQADGEYILKKDVMGCIGQTSLHWELARKLRKLPSVAIPSAEPKTAHWIADIDRWGDVITTVNGYRCDKCNAFDSDKDNYCPNCGAKMVEPQERSE